jgi:hypothetical protein
MQYYAFYNIRDLHRQEDTSLQRGEGSVPLNNAAYTVSGAVDYSN